MKVQDRCIPVGAPNRLQHKENTFIHPYSAVELKHYGRVGSDEQRRAMPARELHGSCCYGRESLPYERLLTLRSTATARLPPRVRQREAALAEHLRLLLRGRNAQCRLRYW